MKRHCNRKSRNLNLKMDGLESVLQGVTPGDLNRVLSTLDGVTSTELSDTIESVKGLTNSDLTEVVDTLPVVDSLCKQNEELTEQLNLVAGAVEGLGLSPALEALGLLEIPTLPDTLEPFSCPTP